MMSKCGKNKEVAHEQQASVSVMCSSHFDVFCDLMITEQTHGSMESICFIKCSEKKKKTDTHFCLVYCLTARGFVLI